MLATPIRTESIGIEKALEVLEDAARTLRAEAAGPARHFVDSWERAAYAAAVRGAAYSLEAVAQECATTGQITDRLHQLQELAFDNLFAAQESVQEAKAYGVRGRYSGKKLGCEKAAQIIEDAITAIG